MWYYGESVPCGCMSLSRRTFFDSLHSESRLREWMAHLMGHGLGFGLFWGSLRHNPVSVAGVGADTHFPDAATVAAFEAAGGGAWTGGSKVPVENSEKYSDIHWRGDVLGDELMSSWYTMGMPGDNPPLSAITVQAMGALGYEVDVRMANPYEVPGAGAMADQDQGPIGNGQIAPSRRIRRIDLRAGPCGGRVKDALPRGRSLQPRGQSREPDRKTLG